MKYQLGKSILIIFVGLGSWTVHADKAVLGFRSDLPTPKVIIDNNKAVDAMKEGDLQTAQMLILEGLSQSPYQPDLHLNLGVNFYALKKYDEAIKSYQASLKFTGSPEVKAMAYFNLGHLAQQAQKVDEALYWYQKVLEIDPDSFETKVNIELLIQEQQQKQNSGEGEKKDQQDQNNQNQDQKGDQNKNQKDQQKDQSQDQQGQQEKENDSKDPKDKENKKYAKNKPQPKPFDSKELTPGDAKKILDELKRQEQKIRTEFQRKEAKEQPKDKDW